MKNTVTTFMSMKQDGKKITELTCYDYMSAKLIDAAGINAILVGDSLGNTVLGYEDTLSVTMEDMIHHGRADSCSFVIDCLNTAARGEGRFCIMMLRLSAV